MSTRIPYAATEDPQALIRPLELPATISGNNNWAVMGDDFAALKSQGADEITTPGAGIIELPPGVWRVTVSGVYTAVDAAVVPIAIDERDADIDQPSPQALQEGTQLAPSGDKTPFEFSRVLHVDPRSDFVPSFVLWGECTTDGVEGGGGVQFDDLAIEVEHIADDSVILGRDWWAGGIYFDAVNQTNIRSSDTMPSSDLPLEISTVSHWFLRVAPDYETNPALLRSGGSTAPVFDHEGFDGSKASVNFTGTEGLTFDSLAPDFDGSDPSWTFFLEFDCASATAVDVLLAIADDSGNYLQIIEVSGTLRVQRTNGGGVVVGNVAIAALSTGKHWLVVSYDPASEYLTAWLDSTTPVLEFGTLGGTSPTATKFSLGILRTGASSLSPTTSNWPRGSFVTGKMITQTEVNAIARHLAAVGDF